MPVITETERVKEIIAHGGGAGLTELEFFAREICAWKDSDVRRDQQLGERFYAGEQDILSRKRTVIGPGGTLEAVENLPNNRVVDNQYAKLVDQKANYLLGKPFTVDCKSEGYAAKLKKIFDWRFRRLLKQVGTDALNGAVGWLCPYYGPDGGFRFKRFPPWQVLPFWADDEHTELDCAVRLYEQEIWEGFAKRTVERVELYMPDGLHRFLLSGSMLIPDVELGEYEPYITAVPKGRDGKLDPAKAQGYTWGRVPLIPWRYNDREIPLLRRVKSLQDGINAILSNFQNNMEEDARNTVLVLENYDGQDLGEFRRNLATFGAVKVRSVEGSRGDVRTLEITVGADNYKAILELFKKALIENARGYDAKDDRLSGNPNQMNIQSMYSDIDLDANGMETEFQASFQDLLWFVSRYLLQTGQGDFTGEEVSVVFNRDILINEGEAIDNCAKSVGMLSEETVVEQHPWTVDKKKELERIKKEEAERSAEAGEYAGAFRHPGGDSGGDEP